MYALQYHLLLFFLDVVGGGDNVVNAILGKLVHSQGPGEEGGLQPCLVVAVAAIAGTAGLHCGEWDWWCRCNDNGGADWTGVARA